jgi:hypothetical protein
VISGVGWEVEHRNAMSGESRWLPVAFFVPIATRDGCAIGVLVLDDGRLVVTTGKLRRAEVSVSDAHRLR